MAFPVYYRVLGLDPGATDQDIHDTFHSLAALYQADGTLENTLAARRLRLITEAYAVLGDPVRRAAYDAQLTGIRSRSPVPLTTPDAAPDRSVEAPLSESTPIAVSPNELPRRPTLLGRLRRRPFRSMGVVVAVTFVLLGAWARPQRPNTNVPLGAPPSIVVPSAHTPLVAAIGTMSPSAIASPSTGQGKATTRSQASSVVTKTQPSVSRGPASHSTPIDTATPVPTQSAVDHSVPGATPPKAKSSGTPAHSPSAAPRPTNSRKQGGFDRASATGRHATISALAMAYEDHPNAPTNRLAVCAEPQRPFLVLPFQGGLRRGTAFQPSQAGLQARAILPSRLWSGHIPRLMVRPRISRAHLPVQGRGPFAGAHPGRPQVTARIVRA